MTSSSKKNRVIFLDLIRAFAVIMMVQGHTIDVLLGLPYRNLDSSIYSTWLFNRGMTAPIFLFTAGTVFNYLFRLHRESFWKNPRVWKGLKRFSLLMFIGYMLRYPTKRIFDLSNVPYAQWQVFYAVDVLQLIACGILSIMILDYISEKVGRKDIIVFGAATILCIVIYPIFDNINWLRHAPRFLASYLYRGTGSNFPLFPWLSYVYLGGILGSYLAGNPDVFKTTVFSKRLLAIGLFFVGASLVGDVFELMIFGKSHYWTTSPNLVLVRIGYVFMLNSAFAYLARKMESIPKIVILLGRNTLLIYVVHLLILYGSPWTLGVINYWNNKFDPFMTILLALEMIGMMIIMVVLLHKFNVKDKPL